MFCPKCGYAYREGVALCPDCREVLVAEPPEIRPAPAEPAEDDKGEPV